MTIRETHNASPLSRRERGQNIKISLTFALCYAALLPSAHAAGESVAVNHAWIREAPPNAVVLSGYAQIANGTNRTITVTHIRSDAFDKVEIHKSEIKNGMARMERLDKLNVEARHAVTLSPNGMHLMLLRPKKTLRAGDHVTVQFTFNTGATVNADAEVRKETTDDQPQDHGHH